ncbi:hypothetical protein PFISCL1PPCAC_17867, partial [Pristionchus fissidentatus]
LPKKTVLTIPVLTEGSTNEWTYILAGGEDIVFRYEIKSGNFYTSLRLPFPCICAHSLWEANFEVKMNFVDSNGITRKTFSKEVKLTRAKDKVALESLRVDTIDTVVAGNYLIQLEMENALKEMKGMHKNALRHDNFFSSGKADDDIVFTFGESPDGKPVSKHLLSLYSRHFRNLIYYG